MTGLRSLGLSTDLLALTGLSEVTWHGDRVVVRTPEEPTYWFGNFVLFRTDVVDPEAQIARFKADIPEVEHVNLLWDSPDMEIGPGHDALREAGFRIEADDVLALDGRPKAVPRPDGIEFREIESDADWAQVMELQAESSSMAGNDRARLEDFIRRRYENARKQISQGLGARFGAFDGDLLVADMGVIVGEWLARYQSVATRPSHRRRGICAALVSHTGTWARDRAPGATLVIVAEANGDAGRIYRRCGFELAETMVSACKPGY